MINDDLERERQQYLEKLSIIIEQEELAPAQATQLMFGEISSWLMVIARLLEWSE